MDGIFQKQSLDAHLNAHFFSNSFLKTGNFEISLARIATRLVTMLNPTSHGWRGEKLDSFVDRRNEDRDAQECHGCERYPPQGFVLNFQALEYAPSP